MKIVHFNHGDPELWKYLGEFISSRNVHKELGGPIYSSPNTQWWVGLKKDKVLGFVSLRSTESVLWFDYAYVIKESRGQGIHEQLNLVREKFAQETFKDSPIRVVVRTERWKHYKSRGWENTSNRGNWVYGIRS